MGVRLIARRKKDDTFELLWQVLVVFPMLFGGWLGFSGTHSILAAVVCAGTGAGLGIGILVVMKMSRIEKLKRSGILDIDKMDGIQFEHYLNHLFQAQGFHVEVTRASGDYGADLILQKDGKRVVVQAKRHSKNVGLKAVQEVQASMAYYKANEAWVVTNRDYTQEARELAKSNGVRLINRNELMQMILEMNPKVAPRPKQVIEAFPQKEVTCDRCGKPMVRRKSVKGEFYGCSGFPKCRNIKPIS
jgi:restriction system protein